MAVEGGCLDFMFLGPPLPDHWIRYWTSSIFRDTLLKRDVSSSIYRLLNEFYELK